MAKLIPHSGDAMLAFRFSPLNTAEPTSDALAQLEIATLFIKRVSPKNLIIDKDNALPQFIMDYIDEHDQADYFAEPEMAEGEMLDMFSSSILQLAKERAKALGDAYPFEIVGPDMLTLRDGPLHAVAASYLSIQAMRLAQKNLIEIIAINETERKRSLAKFSRFFERSFEFASAYAVTGNKGGMPIVLSNCRSSNDLHKKLNGICLKIGSGRVKTMDNWSRLQRSANDGGVDAVVHVGGSPEDGNTTLIIVGATYQQKKIDVKIMGVKARTRFADFFIDRPAPLQGALVRLADADPWTVEKCRLEDCLFYGYDSIWKNMGRRPNPNVDQRLLSRIDASMLRSLRKFGQFAMMDEDGELWQLAYA